MELKQLTHKDGFWWLIIALLGSLAYIVPFALKIGSSEGISFLFAAIFLLLLGVVIGFLRPTRPWRWGIASVLLLPFVQIIMGFAIRSSGMTDQIVSISSIFIMMLVMIPIYASIALPAFIGACIGSYFKKRTSKRAIKNGLAELKEVDDDATLGEKKKLMRIVTLLISGTGGAITIFIIEGIRKIQVFASGSPAPMDVTLTVAFSAFFILGCLIGIRAAVHRHIDDQPIHNAAIFAAGGGIAVGCVVWAIAEGLIFSRFGMYPIYEERTLFPITIFVCWVMAILPSLLGIFLSRFLYTRLRYPNK